MKTFFRTICWYFKFFFTLFYEYPVLLKANKLLKENKTEEFDKYCFEKSSNWAMERIKDSGSTICIEGEENIPFERNVIFVCNHQSDFDTAVLMAMINKPKGFVAKSELQKIPVLKTWMKYTNCVFIDRRDMKNTVKGLNEAIKLVNEGKNMVIFPEGTRSKSDKIGDFKAGSFKLATKTNTPIVPITISGTYKIKEKNRGAIKPAHVNLWIHSPIYTENLNKEEKASLHTLVKKIIEEKLPKD